MYKYLILGAGPAGLAFANKLKDAGEESFLVLEKESAAGGLCRSQDVGGSPFDIGGGHFLDVKNPAVNKYLFRFMPECEWLLYQRDSRIDIHGKQIGYPIEANIWQTDLVEQVEYLKSIAAAGCNIGETMPQRFVDWIYWKLGKKIAEDYMIPYNQKMFGENLDDLGTYWLEKLPDVSFEETLLSCLERKAYGKQPGHARFYYPKKYGYGEVWIRMADAICNHVLYHVNIVDMDFNKRMVKDEKGNVYQAEKIITTIPWKSLKKITGMPVSLVKLLDKLRHSSIRTDYYPHKLDTDAHWIYCPDKNLAYHRILVRHNFCPESIGYWTETNLDRAALPAPTAVFSYTNEYAYPLNTLEKPFVMNKILSFAKTRNIYGLGRWGEHEHYNSDITVARAFRLFEDIGNNR